MIKENLMKMLATVFTSYKYIADGHNDMSSKEVEFWIKQAEAKLGKTTKINWNKFTYNELISLGFTPYSDTLLLANIGHLLLTEVGTEFKSINGETVIYDGKNMSTDVRNNMLAYGIERKNFRSVRMYLTQELIDRLETGERIKLHEAFYGHGFIIYDKYDDMIELHGTGMRTVQGSSMLVIEYNHILDSCIISGILKDNVSYCENLVMVCSYNK